MNGNHETLNAAGRFRYAKPAGADDFRRWRGRQLFGAALKAKCGERPGQCTLLGAESAAAAVERGRRGYPTPPQERAVPAARRRPPPNRTREDAHRRPTGFIPRANPRGGVGGIVDAASGGLAPGGPWRRDSWRISRWWSVGSTVFAHGGVLERHAAYGLDRVNRETSDWISGRKEARRPCTSPAATAWCGRAYSLPEEYRCDCDALENALAAVGGGARRVVVGHTIQGDAGVNAACDGRVIRVDVGCRRGAAGTRPKFWKFSTTALGNLATQVGRRRGEGGPRTRPGGGRDAARVTPHRSRRAKIAKMAAREGRGSFAGVCFKVYGCVRTDVPAANVGRTSRKSPQYTTFSRCDKRRAQPADARSVSVRSSLTRLLRRRPRRTLQHRVEFSLALAVFLHQSRVQRVLLALLLSEAHQQVAELRLVRSLRLRARTPRSSTPSRPSPRAAFLLAPRPPPSDAADDAFCRRLELTPKFRRVRTAASTSAAAASPSLPIAEPSDPQPRGDLLLRRRQSVRRGRRGDGRGRAAFFSKASRRARSPRAPPRGGTPPPRGRCTPRRAIGDSPRTPPPPRGIPRAPLSPPTVPPPRRVAHGRARPSAPRSPRGGGGGRDGRGGRDAAADAGSSSAESSSAESSSAGSSSPGPLRRVLLRPVAAMSCSARTAFLARCSASSASCDRSKLFSLAACAATVSPGFVPTRRRWRRRRVWVWRRAR